MNLCVYVVRLWNYLGNDTLKNINNIKACKFKYKKRLFYKYVTVLKFAILICVNCLNARARVATIIRLP